MGLLGQLDLQCHVEWQLHAATELIKLRALLLRQLAVSILGLILLIHMMAPTHTMHI